ncbi:MAG: lamin tail domain-containing protein [Methanoregulaceae archaeon]|nr:lamin tail domain-containing protein [Methanoregulaceae archaeon]
MSRLFPVIILTTLIVFLFIFGGCTVQTGDDGQGGARNERFSPGIPYPARVDHVIDGDTLRIALLDGSQETVRILGIDTPELKPGENDPDTFEGITDPWFLSSWGEVASSTLYREVEGREVVVTIDRAAGERDQYGRLLAYLQTADGTDIGELLISRGLARVYTAESFTRKERYLTAQEVAMRQRTGLWSGIAPSPSGSNGVFIVSVHYDAAGDDRINLTDEYIILKNGGSITIILTGWQIRDSDGFVYTFPEATIGPGAELTLHTGNGIADSTNLSMGSTVPVLDNDNDIVTLYDTSGTEVFRFSWG